MTKIEFDDAAIEAARKALLVPEGGGEMTLLDDEIHVLKSSVAILERCACRLAQAEMEKNMATASHEGLAAEYHRIRQRPRAGRRPHRRAEADNTRLREELTAYTDAALYDALMSGPAFKGWNRSQLDRARRITEARAADLDVSKPAITRKGSGFNQLCPQCVASKFACDFHHNDYAERGFIKP